MHDLFCSNDAQVQPAEQHFEQSHAFLYFTDAVLIESSTNQRDSFCLHFFFSLFLKKFVVSSYSRLVLFL